MNSEKVNKKYSPISYWIVFKILRSVVVLDVCIKYVHKSPTQELMLQITDTRESYGTDRAEEQDGMVQGRTRDGQEWKSAAQAAIKDPSGPQNS